MSRKMRSGAEADRDNGARRTRSSRTSGTPLWVKIFVLAAVVALVLMVVAMLIGGGQHGPGRHTSSTTAAATSVVAAADAGHPRRP